MLVATFNEDDCEPDTYDEYNDHDYDYDMRWEDFRRQVEDALENRKFPLQLIALNSNWRGQTGYAEAESVDDIINKLTSFDSSYYKLHKIGNSYEFRLSTHDVPTGFTVQIRSLNARTN
jgi:hypothetical protein